MKLALKMLLCKVAMIAAPVVTIFYRKGIWLTPDDPVSPYGCGTTPGASDEPQMRRMYEKFGTRFGDWWWLAMRNRAYGLSYKLKPQHFKDMKDYSEIQSAWTQTYPRWYGAVRYIQVDGYYERTYSVGKGKIGFHVIAGYRLRPVFDQWYANRFNGAGIPYRPINMDARPILSIRAGTQDD